MEPPAQTEKFTRIRFCITCIGGVVPMLSEQENCFQAKTPGREPPACGVSCSSRARRALPSFLDGHHGSRNTLLFSCLAPMDRARHKQPEPEGLRHLPAKRGTHFPPPFRREAAAEKERRDVSSRSLSREPILKVPRPGRPREEPRRAIHQGYALPA